MCKVNVGHTRTKQLWADMENKTIYLMGYSKLILEHVNLSMWKLTNVDCLNRLNGYTVVYWGVSYPWYHLKNNKSNILQGPISLNSLAPRKTFDLLFFNDTKDRYIEHFLWNCPQVNATRPQRLVNIASGNGLVPSVNKPLPGPILTHIYAIYAAIWRQQATMC